MRAWAMQGSYQSSIQSSQHINAAISHEQITPYPLTLHHILRTRRASSVIRSGVQAGSQTKLTLTMPTPGALATASSTIVGNSPAAGQFGVVSVIMTSTLRSSLISTL